MNCTRILPHLLLLTSASGTLQAQAVLRPGPSSRATSEVSLAFPRPAAATAAMPGMAMAAAPAAAPAAAAPVTPAAPARRPLVIRLDYGQPHLRGRTLHTDSLVPYDKPWRMGANDATTLSTDVDLVVGGAALKKGTYVLYAVPSRTAWKLVIQRSVGQTAMQFSDSNDVARIDLRHTAVPSPVESLTMWLIPSLEPGPAKGELRIVWGVDQLSTNWSIR